MSQRHARDHRSPERTPTRTLRRLAGVVPRLDSRAMHAALFVLPLAIWPQVHCEINTYRVHCKQIIYRDGAGNIHGWESCNDGEVPMQGEVWFADTWNHSWEGFVEVRSVITTDTPDHDPEIRDRRKREANVRRGAVQPPRPRIVQ